MKTFIRSIIHKLGFHIERLNNGEKDFDRSLGGDEDKDIQILLRNIKNPIIFDIGANTGQSITRFKSLFLDPMIYSFEPDKVALQELRRNHPDNAMNSYELALGDSPGKSLLYLNTFKDMNSLLKSNNPRWGKNDGESEISVSTVDKFCEENNIYQIDLLKTDTQGFELQVLKGSSKMIAEKRIKLVAMEVIFSNMYENIAPFDEVYRFMLDNDFRLVSFYKFYFYEQLADWSDALFLRVD